MEQDQKERGLPPPEGKFGFSYNLGCRAERTVAKSLLFSLAERQKLLMLIGILHRHAHQRLCQLAFLLVYVIGAGIENLEQCECYFSKSNALGGYVAHHDEYKTYANLSKFIYTNYKSALTMLTVLGKVIKALQILSITDINDVSQWLADERRSLEERKDLAVPEAVEREYLMKLKALADVQQSLMAVQRLYMGHNYLPSDVIDQPAAKKDEADTKATEKAVFDLMEQEWKLLRDVQTLEVKLGIGKGERWASGSPKWQEVEKQVQ
ncbi:hypothetical protein Moror_13520 [Moniliophthora roreri MCA 2997]|uniref:Uncharacterized protein n=1 Tax=Moniliophthora roreri (strain MCA 2997) TaxID=1381753 RepID=V2WQH7_MONRO|nr:hypothetical protein Moror_13520 [Moniliophthora roreri MCA 2997]